MSAAQAGRLISYRALVLLALGFLFHVSGHAETVVNVPTAPESEATIKLWTPWSQTPRFGFAPVLVTIENRAKTDRSWQLGFEAGMRVFSTGVLTAFHEIEVAASQTRQVWIFVPVAEPGVNVSGGVVVSGSSPRAWSPTGGQPAIRITDTSTGKKVTRTVTTASGRKHVTETEINRVAGTMITTTTPPVGKATIVNSSLPMPLAPGSEITVTIDRLTGFVSPVLTRTIPGSTAPAVVRYVETSGTPAAARGGGGGGGGRRGGGIAISGAPTTIPAPTPFGPMTMSVQVAGPGVTGVRLPFGDTTGANGMRPFAVSTSLEPTLKANLSTLLSGAPNISAVQPDQLPADWRIWSPFAGVVLGSAEYRGLDSARRSALRAWVALGGQLCLSPDATSGAERAVRATDRVEKLGAGTIVEWAVPLADLPKPDLASAITPSVMPERVMPPVLPPLPTGPTVTEADRQAALAARVAAFRASREATLAAGRARGRAQVAAFPLGDNVQLLAGTSGLPNHPMMALDVDGPLYAAIEENEPHRIGLAIFLVAFAVVIGPLNLFWFAPANRRHRLFVTTPLLAIAASIVLAITILVQDGLGGDGTRRALVVLLPGENQAAVIQEQAARTGFVARRSFALPDDVQLTSIPLDEPRYAGNQISFARGDGRASGDWFRSRARQAQLLQRVAPTRSRVERVGTAADSAPIVQSSLGTTLRDFVFIGDGGQLWRVAELPSGQRVTLERGGLWLGEHSGPLVPGGSARFKTIFEAATLDEPGRWGAFGGATELAPIATLGSIRWDDGQTIIYTGMLENNSSTNVTTPSAANPGARL